MCGIFGVSSYNTDISKLLEGLSLLEYRGYDSAGVSFIENEKLTTIKVKGKISNLRAKITRQHPINIGIGHTRWSTHGVPSEHNAHPHANENISIVHNGIIENANQLKLKLLEEESAKFISDTDSEVILHLISSYIKKGLSHFKAVRETTKNLHGSFAIVVMFKDQPDTLIATKKHSPLVLGYGKKENLVSSDAYSLAKYVDSVSYLEDGDIAIIKQDDIQIFDIANTQIKRQKSIVTSQATVQDKGRFSHYMQKEIYDQPTVSKEVIDKYIHIENCSINIPDFDFASLKKIYITACGTSYFAGMIAKFWLEEIVKISVDIQIASEVNYGYLPVEKNSLGIFISQSGETADTISALRFWKKHQQKSLSIVNAKESTISRETDYCLPIYAGHEIGVASTKAFTNQLIVLLLIALKAAYIRKQISNEEIVTYVKSLEEVPGRIAEILSHEDEYQKIAKSLVKTSSILYIGKGVSYAIALEGALKLKEISYIHAEAIMSGELKHGSIALIDKNMPVVAVVPEDKNFNSALANVQTAIARNGQIFLLTSDKGYDLMNQHCADTIIINQPNNIISPIIYNIPLQLLAYHVGVMKGNNVDQPRNLAKAVTV